MGNEEILTRFCKSTNTFSKEQFQFCIQVIESEDFKYIFKKSRNSMC